MFGIHPGVFFLAVLVLLYAASWVGSLLRVRRPAVEQDSASFKTLESATLALMGLLLGFTFSMAVGRYDARKQLEVTEANAIGTAWLRTATLPEPARSMEQGLFRQYMPVRLEFLSSGTSRQAIEASLTRASALQSEMWSTAVAVAQTRPDAVANGFLSSLNDTFDVTESRTAAFENRIPGTAWVLLLLIGCVSSVLVGVGLTSRSRVLRLVLPLVLAAALALTLDLDSPRSGFIHVHQHSLERVAQTVAGTSP